MLYLPLCPVAGEHAVGSTVVPMTPVTVTGDIVPL